MIEPILDVIKTFIEGHGLIISTWTIEREYDIPCGYMALITNDPVIKKEFGLISVSYDGELEVSHDILEFECRLSDPKCFNKLARFLETIYG